MCYKIAGTTFFRFVTNHVFDRQLSRGQTCYSHFRLALCMTASQLLDNHKDDQEQASQASISTFVRYFRSATYDHFLRKNVKVLLFIQIQTSSVDNLNCMTTYIFLYLWCVQCADGRHVLPVRQRKFQRLLLKQNRLSNRLRLIHVVQFLHIQILETLLSGKKLLNGLIHNLVQISARKRIKATNNLVKFGKSKHTMHTVVNSQHHDSGTKNNNTNKSCMCKSP